MKKLILARAALASPEAEASSELQTGRASSSSPATSDSKERDASLQRSARRERPDDIDESSSIEAKPRFGMLRLLPPLLLEAQSSFSIHAIRDRSELSH
jgi:hypothetical protein